MHERPLETLLTSQGALPADAVEQVLATSGDELDALTLRLLPLAARRSWSPVSQFPVGAVVQGASSAGRPGTLYLGANLEFPGQPLTESVHAEQSAINNAWLHGESVLQAIAVSAAPCGHCRQFLRELSTADSLRILISTDSPRPNGSLAKHSLAELLPRAFGPQDLGICSRLLMPELHDLHVESDDPLVVQAVAAAAASYAPYTGHPAGVALRTSTGEIVCGRLAENAAFNPTLSAMSSALAAWHLLNEGHPADIIDAVLVETASSSSQYLHAEGLLRSVGATALLLRSVRIQPE